MSLSSNDTPTTEIYTLSLHDALPICVGRLKVFLRRQKVLRNSISARLSASFSPGCRTPGVSPGSRKSDRKSTRLNSSHSSISYAVFCLKKKNDDIALVDAAATEDNRQ